MRIALLLLTASLVSAQTFEERQLATIPEGASFESIQKGPEGNSWRMTFPLIWAKDGSMVAYAAFLDGATVPVVNDEVGEAWQFLSSPMIAGGTVAFRAGRRVSDEQEEWFVLVNGEPIGESAWIGEPSVSPDGESIAWWTQPKARITPEGPYTRGLHQFVIAEKGRKGWEVENAGGPKDDARALLRPVWTNKGDVATAFTGFGYWKVMLWTGRKWERLTGDTSMITAFAVAPNGSRAATVGHRVSSTAISMEDNVMVGDKFLEGDFKSSNAPVFGPKGKLLAVRRTTENGGMDYIIGDGDVTTVYDYVHGAVFDPKGKQIAFVANVDGKPVSRFDRKVGEPGYEGGHTFVVVRSVKGKDSSETSAYSCIRDLAFSPDGKRIAFCAKDGDKWHLVVDSKSSEAFDDVGPPQFSKDGKQVAFGARKGRELWWKVMEL